MKCLECNREISERISTHRYCETDGINVLLEGVTITECGCGEGVVIPKMAQLNRHLASEMAKKAERLTPGEIRWLRKYLGWSGVDFARRFDVDPSTVSRWENGRKPMGGTAERLLRILALTQDPVEEYPLPDEITADVRSIRMGFATSSKSWQPAA